MLTATTVFSNNEWDIVHRVAQPGDSWTPLARRNGVVLDVPTDPMARVGFMEQYPYSPVTPTDANQVFVYRPFQITLTGRMSHGGGAYFDITDKLSCAYPADSWQAKLTDTPALHFPDGSEFFCCMPKETMLMWGRAPLILKPDERRVIQDRFVKRQRIVLAAGVLDVDGVIYSNPTVVAVHPNQQLTAVTNVWAGEVWS